MKNFLKNCCNYIFHPNTIQKLLFINPITLCKDKRMVEMSERDFNYFIKEMNGKTIEAGDNIILKGPDNTRLIFIIRKNKI